MDAGLVTDWELRHDFDRVFPDVYMAKGYVLDAAAKARAAGHWAKGQGVLVGLSAAAMYGTRWLNAGTPAELALPGHCKPPNGIRTVRDTLERSECCEIDGFRVTTPARTGFDIGRRLSRAEAVPILDALCAATGLTPDDIAALAEHHSGLRGIRQLARTIPLIDSGAESPPESLTRLLLIDDGLPTPATQLVIRDDYGCFVARVDMGWRRWQVAVEYDGIQHWADRDQRTKDIDRFANLESLGWRIVRVNAQLLRTRPHVILDRVRFALRTQGAQLDG
ncbi:endonuclease domain-containing protein [Nocardia sp. SYP-A9097]|uniref:endonuclease domain-containing protein n=1 Tax=Nocardia sp. SYP-A9097 TaxID=2663237 RepID=UPI001E62EDF4|nr:DUF559 domain-containing protein [Nocardia sp. SYP-A9097]